MHISSIAVITLMASVASKLQFAVTEIVPGGIDIEPSVVGGDTAGRYEFPSIVNILISQAGSTDPSICGGSLIDWDIVITAAHCVCSPRTGSTVNVNSVKITAGEYDLTVPDGTEQQVPVQEIRTHEDFLWTSSILQHDIALIKLSKKLKPSRAVGKIQVPKYDIIKRTKVGQVAGWGDPNNTQTISTILRKADIQIHPNSKCGLKNDRKLCAGGSGKDSCSGDSGGPLVCTSSDGIKQLCGIVSYGSQPQKCGDKPGVYTSVFAYRQWIESNKNFSNVYLQIVYAVVGFLVIAIAIIIGIILCMLRTRISLV